MRPAIRQSIKIDYPLMARRLAFKLSPVELPTCCKLDTDLHLPEHLTPSRFIRSRLEVFFNPGIIGIEEAISVDR